MARLWGTRQPHLFFVVVLLIVEGAACLCTPLGAFLCIFVNGVGEIGVAAKWAIRRDFPPKASDCVAKQCKTLDGSTVSHATFLVEACPRLKCGVSNLLTRGRTTLYANATAGRSCRPFFSPMYDVARLNTGTRDI